MTQGPLQTDYQRYRHGDSQPVLSPDVVSATVLRIGDLIYIDASGNPDNAASVGFGGVGEPATKLLAQELFHDTFLGVAAQRSPNGSTNPIRVNTKARHEFTVVEDDYAVGDYLGPEENDDQDALTNVLVKVASPNLAIGQAAENKDAATSLIVEVNAVVLGSGVQNAE